MTPCPRQTGPKSDPAPKRHSNMLIPVLAIILTCSISLAACSKSIRGDAPVVYGLTLAPSGIDPHLNASSELTIPLRSVYDTLIFQDPESGAFVPGLAERWEVSTDGLTYTFFLRRDVVFHDSTPFDAEAVRANLEYTLNPDNHSQKARFMLGPLDEIQVLDEYTIALHLQEPYAPLLDSLAQSYLGLASPKALEDWGPSDYQFHQVGTGPYRFVEYIPNDHLTLEANSDYEWGPSIYQHPKAEIQTIIFRFYEDPATRALALESGEVDVIGEIPQQDAARLTTEERFEVHAVPIPGQPLQYMFNTLRPPTDDLRVRRALVMAVDRPSVVSTIFGPYSPVSEGPLSSNTLGFTPDFPYPGFDRSQAGDLLDQAGWIDQDGDGLRSRAGEPLALTLVVPPWGSNSDVGQLVAAAWEAVGANVRLEVAPGFGPLKEAQSAGEYHAIGINFFGADPDLLRSFYASDGLYSWTGHKNEALDLLLERGAHEWLDSETRLGLYAKVFEHIRDECLLLPVRDYVNLVVSNRRVSNLRFSSQGWSPLLIDLSLEP